MLKNRREKYRTQHNKDLENIHKIFKYAKGHLLCILIRNFCFSVYFIYNVCVDWQRAMYSM